MTNMMHISAVAPSDLISDPEVFNCMIHHGMMMRIIETPLLHGKGRKSRLPERQYAGGSPPCGSRRVFANLAGFTFPAAIP
jgi:hypothetical protein